MARILSEAFTGKKNAQQPVDGELCGALVEVNFTAAAIAVGDIITLLDLPPGVQLIDYTLVTQALGGTPAFSIGEENAAGTDLTTVYEAGMAANDNVVRATKSAASAANRYSTRRIALKATAAATAAAGKTMLVVLHLRG